MRTGIPRKRIAGGVYTSDTAPAAAFQSPQPELGPFSWTMYRSTAVTRPSSLNPILMRPWKPGRADPMKFSSARLIRMRTGRPVFLAIKAGTVMMG